MLSDNMKWTIFQIFSQFWITKITITFISIFEKYMLLKLFISGISNFNLSKEFT